MLEVPLVGVMRVYSALLQLPGLDQPDQTLGQQMQFVWNETGFMRYPLALCVLIGATVIIWKFFDLLMKFRPYQEDPGRGRRAPGPTSDR